MGLLSWVKGKEKSDWDSEDITFEICKQSDEVYNAFKKKFLEGNLQVRFSKNCIPDIKSGKQPSVMNLDTSNVHLYTEVYRSCFNAIKTASKQYDHRIAGYAIKIDGVTNNIFAGSGTDVNIIGLNYRKNSQDDYHFGVVGRKSAIKKYKESISAEKNFWIEELNEGYVLHNVTNNGRFCNIGWQTPHVFNKNSRVTQLQHINATKNSRIRVPSSVVYHTTLEMLYNHRDHPDEKQRRLVDILKRTFSFELSLGKPYFCTSSIARYGGIAEDGVSPDDVIHNCGYADEQKIERKPFFSLSGSDKYINSDQKDIEDIVHAILGTKDLDKVEKVYKWLSGKKPYLLRENGPNLNDDRCIVLGTATDTSRFEISLAGGTHLTRLSEGVVLEYI